jgi:iron complex transport system substrate-binding protein
MPRNAVVVSLDPLSLDAVFASVEQAGAALGVPDAGVAVAADLRAAITRIAASVTGKPRPRVLAAEWLDPVYCGGHWVPEMIEAAGGNDPFGTPGEQSHRISWSEIAQADPDIVVLMPCGFHADEVASRYQEISASPEFVSLRAVRELSVYAVDATSYFSRPGPRLVDGTRILTHIFHPDRKSEPIPTGAVLKLTGDGSFAPVV